MPIYAGYVGGWVLYAYLDHILFKGKLTHVIRFLLVR